MEPEEADVEAGPALAIWYPTIPTRREKEKGKGGRGDQIGSNITPPRVIFDGI